MFGWAQAPARSAITPAGSGFVGEIARPIGELFGAGLASQMEQECGEVAKVGQVCRGLRCLSEDRHLLPGEGSVDADLQSEDILAGRLPS